jgi:caffeoyl-CoA O-methyltransferase
MKPKDHSGRRSFLRGTGSALTLLALTSRRPAAAAQAESRGAPAATRGTPRLQALLREMEAQSSQYWSVPRQDGEFLHLQVEATHAVSVLEVGTSHGYSAIWMGLALEQTGGQLTTIEIDPGRHALARRHIAAAGLSSRVRLLLGDAHRVVPQLSGPFDFVFLDADKEGQVDYFRKLYPGKLAPGGILVAHNAIRQARSMRDYLDLVQRHPDFDSVTVSATMDDGFCVSYRRREG